MKRVLLTGASGFIGRHCIPFLQDKGYEIFALYRTKSLKDFPQIYRNNLKNRELDKEASQNFDPERMTIAEGQGMSEDQNFEIRPTQSKPDSSSCFGIHWVQADLLDPLQIKDVMEKITPSHLLHLAWDVTPGKFVTASDNLHWIKAGLALLESFYTNQGQRIVMAGTCFEYDLTNSPLKEQNTPLKPATLYGASKLSLNHVVESYARQMGLSAAWARIFYLYGPNEYPQRFIPSIIRSILKRQVVPCTHCQQVRDFLYVEDVAEGLVELLDSTIEGSINIASGEGVSLRTMIEQIENQLQIKDLVQFGALQANALEPSHIIGNIERLSQELKWQPKWSLQEGLAKTIQWWNQVS